MPRVLVLDDDPAVLRALCRALGPYEVTASSSPLLALEAIAGDERFDAVVCDVNMPEMDGVTFYETARARRPELAHRFVFVSGNAGQVRQEFFETRVLLVKPVARAALRAAIETVLVS